MERAAPGEHVFAGLEAKAKEPHWQGSPGLKRPYIAQDRGTDPGKPVDTSQAGKAREGCSQWEERREQRPRCSGVQSWLRSARAGHAHLCLSQ